MGHHSAPSNHVEEVPVLGTAERRTIFVLDVEVQELESVEEGARLRLRHVRLVFSIGPRVAIPKRFTASTAPGRSALVTVFHIPWKRQGARRAMRSPHRSGLTSAVQEGR